VPQPVTQPRVQLEFLRSETEARLFKPKVTVASILVVILLTIFVWQNRQPRRLAQPLQSDSSGLQVDNPEPQPTVTPTASGAHLTDVRHWSKKDYTTIGVFLDAPARYHVIALHHPERINVDLRDTSVAAELASKKGMVVADVNNGLVRRVLAAQGGSITHLVVELKEPTEYNALMSAESPYWLMIALHPRRRKH
jgi:hypothetical protein